jgi:lipoprotein-anchoring transpeptidase ErfK/SrfK
VYDRARYALAGAPLTINEIRQERFALEAAIRKIESEIVVTRGAAPSPPTVMDKIADDRIDAGQGVSVPSRRSARRLSYLLVSGLAAAATILVAAFAGYQYWRKPLVDYGKALVRAPAGKVASINAGTITDESRSYIFRRQFVYHRSIHPVGTIIITKSQNFLYLVRPNTAAVRYTIGVGRACSGVVGLLLVSAKEDWSAKNPEPPKVDTPLIVRAGDGELGARSLALSDTGHRIHGSEGLVTGRVTGCFPLDNDDVIDLYERVALGARVVMN